MMEALVFYALAALLVFSSVMVITRKNPVASAVYLVVTLFLVASFYALLGADFAAAIQVLVYAGAIMVLFVFVIMLLNLDPESLRGPRIPVPEFAVLGLTMLCFGIIGIRLLSDAPATTAGVFTQEAIQKFGGNTRAVGMKLMVNYLWPFELTSMLILLAIIASIVIAKKNPPSKETARN